MSKKLDVKAIFVEHFGFSESTQKSYDKIIKVLKAMETDAILTGVQ